jgi:hypothetical protein
VITQDKNHIPPPRKPRGFSHQSYRSLTGKRQRHSERITCRRPLQWFLNVWDNVPMDLKYACQQYFTYMCFLGFIPYNKTFIACGFRKYENVFTHEYHIPLGPRVSYSPRPEGNMILVGEYIFIFPEPACNKCIQYYWNKRNFIQYGQVLLFSIVMYLTCTIMML